ncbi:MAG: hypothetical protein C0442_00410 [Chlorobiaceae bacterium]|nr:hypothetical protein [Chlorobiaceae bacterium]
MTSNKYFPALVCAFGVSVISIIPGFKNFTCCLFVPMASIAALFIDQKLTRFEYRISFKHAIKFGFVMGLYATFMMSTLDVFITYILKTNDLIRSIPDLKVALAQLNMGDAADEAIKLIEFMETEIIATGFSAVYTFFMLINNFVINSVFGIIGGLIGMSFINTKYFKKPSNN